MNLMGIGCGIMVATATKFVEMHPASYESLCFYRPAKMSHDRDILFIAQRPVSPALRVSDQMLGHSMEPCRSHLNRVCRHEPGVGGVSKTDLIVSVVIERDPLFHAVVPRFVKRAFGDLKHPNGARSRREDFRKISTPTPAPIGADDWISVALHLSERGQ